MKAHFTQLMKVRIVLPLLSLVFTFSATSQVNKLEELLANIPEVIAEKVEANPNFESTYKLKIRQPLDHFDSKKGFFYQTVYLSHRGFDNPTVIATEGYKAFKRRVYEPTKLLDANQILVEHRYYGSSVPDSIDYRYLNMKQATADLHRIKELFSDIYAGKWVSTGGSKGGVTTIFYHYFYPDDVEVSIPYVAPIKATYEEKKIYHFLDTVGTDACRKAIQSFQTLMLKNREQVLPYIEMLAAESNETFTSITLPEAFEYAVMEFSFAFWQWGEDCEKIPTDTTSMLDLVKYFVSISSPLWFSDKSIKDSQSHYYQVATELGYYGYETKEFHDLIVDLPIDKNPMCIFLSPEIHPTFNDKLLTDLSIWLKTHGNKFIYIYGDRDPWSAAAVPKSDLVDAEWFMMQGKHHGSARIAHMTDTERERLVATLERWLSIEIKNTGSRKLENSKNER